MSPTQNTTPGARSEPLDEAAAERFDKAFQPKGAVAFFVLLVILGLVIWYGIYFLMLQRM